MAKRRKNNSRPTTRRRRRISGFGGGHTSELLGTALGAVASPFIDSILEKARLTDPKMKAGAKAAIAIIALPKLMPKNALVQSAGKGMIAFAAIQLASNMGLYKNGTGIGASEDIYMNLDQVSGVNDTIMGMDDDIVNGIDIGDIEDEY